MAARIADDDDALSPKRRLVNALTGDSQDVGSTTEGARVERPFDEGANTTSTQMVPVATGASNSGTNVDRFLSLLNSGQYSQPQGAIDAFNALGLNADATGLSSHYGSSPAFYANGAGQIGLPDRYLTKNADGTWSTTMRSGGGGGGGGSALAVPDVFRGSGVASLLQSDPTASISAALGNIGAQGSGYLAQLIAALKGGG